MNKRTKFYTIYQPNWNRFTISDEHWNKLISNLKLDEFQEDEWNAKFMLNEVIEELNRTKKWEFTDNDVVKEFLKFYEESFWITPTCDEEEWLNIYDIDWEIWDEEEDFTDYEEKFLNCENSNEFLNVLENKEFEKVFYSFETLKINWRLSEECLIAFNEWTEEWVALMKNDFNDFKESLNNFNSIHGWFNDDVIWILRNKRELLKVDKEQVKELKNKWFEVVII